MKNVFKILLEKTLVIGLTSIFAVGFIRLFIGIITGECSNITFGIYG